METANGTSAPAFWREKLLRLEQEESERLGSGGGPGDELRAGLIVSVRAMALKEEKAERKALKASRRAQAESEVAARRAARAEKRKAKEELLVARMARREEREARQREKEERSRAREARSKAKAADLQARAARRAALLARQAAEQAEDQKRSAEFLARKAQIRKEAELKLQAREERRVRKLAAEERKLAWKAHMAERARVLAENKAGLLDALARRKLTLETRGTRQLAALQKAQAQDERAKRRVRARELAILAAQRKLEAAKMRQAAAQQRLERKRAEAAARRAGVVAPLTREAAVDLDATLQDGSLESVTPKARRKEPLGLNRAEKAAVAKSRDKKEPEVVVVVPNPDAGSDPLDELR